MPPAFPQRLIRTGTIMTDMKVIHATRAKESIKPLFEKTVGPHLLFLKSSSDVGVIRNNGRNGARFAPQSFMFHFKKMTQDHDLKNWRFSEIEVSSQDKENENFHSAQAHEASLIKKTAPLKHDLLCHIGGGHDHIYPLVTALKEDFAKIIIINIDAHADTRTDSEFHSGTPFRQLDSEINNFKIFQIGLHPYSNSFSTLTPLKSEMPILWKEDCVDDLIKTFFEKITSEITDKSLVVFSLDADAIKGSQMPGVSAVNADGISLEQLKKIMTHYLELPLSHSPVVGIYELNPVYDHLSGISMNTLANFIFHTLKSIKG